MLDRFDILDSLLLWQGYFLALFSRIQKLLSTLEVENLVLPAAEKAKFMWVNRLGFRDMSQERVSNIFIYIKHCILQDIVYREDKSKLPIPGKR